MNFGGKSYGTNFSVERQFKRETNLIYLGLTYKLNEGIKQREKKPNGEEIEDTEDY
jgi:hypothetical protein